MRWLERERILLLYKLRKRTKKGEASERPTLANEFLYLRDLRTRRLITQPFSDKNEQRYCRACLVVHDFRPKKLYLIKISLHENELDGLCNLK